MLKAVAAKSCKAGVACVLGFVFVLFSAQGQARNHPSTDGLATITLAQLPPQGRETYSLIRQGGPFPYDKDGTVFGNRERLLPAHKRGYYREYTVRTPGARNRGAPDAGRLLLHQRSLRQFSRNCRMTPVLPSAQAPA